MLRSKIEPGEGIKMHNVTLIPGDGIGPEVAYATKRLIDASGVKINWEVQEASGNLIEKYGTPLPQNVIDSIKRNGVALKGPITTPIGEGFRSVNVALRKELDLFVNIRPVKTYKGIVSKYDNVDIVILRENTEDLYAGVEHMIGEDAAESIKIFTRKGCERIIRFAFEHARKESRKKVTAVHKANIMKCTDGMFLNIARSISKEYPYIEFEDMIIDAMCMRLVQSPESYDVLVLPNLYGDIVSDLCAGLVGGLGVAPGANIGKDLAVYEPVHGSAPSIAGKNIANPTAMMLSGVNMLKFLGEVAASNRIEKAIAKVLTEGKSVTCDLGGKAGTCEYTDRIISALDEIPL